MTEPATIYTIGHSTHTIEEFLALLDRHKITAVCDVRSVPYSQFQPQFGREILAKKLKQHKIGYVFLGKELGGRGNDSSAFESGRVQYRRLAETPEFRSGIERVRAGSATQRIALMCTEREPLNCHRTLLVSRELEARGVPVIHILADGNAEAHRDTIARLFTMLKLEPDLFRSPSELLDDAYAEQERRIAYTVDAATPESAT